MRIKSGMYMKDVDAEEERWRSTELSWDRTQGSRVGAKGDNYMYLHWMNGA
jgi:hypothetical protein